MALDRFEILTTHLGQRGKIFISDGVDQHVFPARFFVNNFWYFILLFVHIDFIKIIDK